VTGSPDGDTGVYLWNMWVFRHETLIERGPAYFTSAVFSLGPPVNLSLHNYTLFANLLALPLQGIMGLVSAFNLVYLFLAVLNAYTMYLLARHVCRARLEAWLAGLLFGFSAFLTARGTAHFSLVAAAPLPLFTLFLLKAGETGKRRYAVGAGLALAWAGYCDPYLAVFCLLLGLAFLATSTFQIRRASQPGGRLANRLVTVLIIGLAALVAWIKISGGGQARVLGFDLRYHTFYNPVFFLTLALLARLVLWWRPRLQLKKGVAFGGGSRLVLWGVAAATLALAPSLLALSQQVSEDRFLSPPVYWRSSPRGVDAVNYLMPNPNHRVFGSPFRSWLTRERADGFAENVAAISFVALAVLGIARWRWQWKPPVFWVFLALFFCLLSLGPFVTVGGLNTYVPTPWALLRFVPGVGLVRSPSRFAIVVMMAIAALFSLALTRMAREYPQRRGLVLALVGGVLLLELAPLPRPLYSASVPSFCQTIARDPRPIRVLELPTGARDGTSSAGNFSPSALFHQTVHGKHLLGGYLSRVSPKRVKAYREMPVMDALFTLSEGRALTPRQLRRAWGRRERFLDRSRLGYVIVNRRQASWELERFAIEILDLVPIEEEGDYALYAPAASLRELRESSPPSESAADRSLPVPSGDAR
jgi:hypothetical protein